MTSVDELFKRPGVPGSNKRKSTNLSGSSRNSKIAKHSVADEAKARYNATVENGSDDAEDNDYGPSQPPDDGEEGEDYGPQAPPDDEDEDDEDGGRFFGGGVDKGTASAIDYIDAQDAAEGEDYVMEKIDKTWVRRTGLNFEKKINANAELRAKYENDPQKFMASEADLDETIKALSILSEHTELYSEFVRLGCVGSLVGLLAHENTDIAIDAIEIISELIDEDVAAEDADWEALADAILQADFLSLLASNFSRFDESHESDRAGVYHALSTIENLTSRPKNRQSIAEDTELLLWIIARMQREESSLGQNKQYAAEVLSILLNSTDIATKVLQLPNTNVIDILLQLLSAFRRKDPATGSSEEEYAENLFDALTSLLFYKMAKTLFVEAEGVELAMFMLREGKFSKPRALRLLDHAVSSAGGATEESVTMSEKIVEVGGLKTLFGMLVKKQDNSAIEHLMGVLCALLRALPGDSPARIRTLAKFVEKDYEKLARIVSFRKDYAMRLSAADAFITKQQSYQSKEIIAEMAEEFESQRLEAGLSTLQQIDMILAWLVAEDDGAASKIGKLFEEQGEDLRALKRTLQQQLQSLGDEDADAGESSLRDVLSTLVTFLD